jgi:RNA polymerase sigma factor (sigma-70 family)
VSGVDEGERLAVAPDGEAARKRVAVETYVRNEAALRRTARRYSICSDDADDALQRGLEILLRKAPSEDPRELIRWTQTVVKHEALAVRRERERILSGPAAVAPEPGKEDWVALLPSQSAGPAERAERHEAVARGREALQSLKPQELRALTLLAEGYSYQEIGEITGYSRTKINRCLAEGRERFRRIVSHSEDGRRCAELRPLLSAFCDGEAGAAEVATVREHLRACAHCRSTLRAYRAAPAAAAALAPALALDRSLLDRAHEAITGLAARFAGGGTADSTLSQVAASGGSRGAGVAALAKLMAVCLGTVGGATACVATGVIPAPLGIGAGEAPAAKVEHRSAPLLAAEPTEPTVEYETAPPPSHPQQPRKDPKHKPVHREPEPVVEAAPVAEAAPPTGATEYALPPPSPPVESSGGSAPSAGGDPAGEFGP